MYGISFELKYNFAYWLQEEEFIPSLLSQDDEDGLDEPPDLFSQLENFRQQWKHEIQKIHNKNNDSNGNQTPSTEEEVQYKGIHDIMFLK